MKGRKNKPQRIVELEDAMNKVLFTQFKKDAKEAHELVESYGYKIEKYGGFFGIQNPETYKEVRLKESNGWRGMWIKEVGTGKKITDKEFREHKINIDLLGYLNTPFNKDWYYVIDRDACRDDGSSANAYHPTWDKRDALRRARRNVEDCKDNIDKYKKQIDEYMDKIKWLQEQVERNVGFAYAFENDLKHLKAEYGLKEGA